jgi:hypothetical protein
MVVDNMHSSGARSALPMGVAPEAIVELYLFKYRLKISLSLIIIFVMHKKIHFVTFLSGARPALSIGVAPETMMGCLHPIIGSELIFFD